MRATFSPKQVALLIAPPVLLAGMYQAYRGLVSLTGPKGGYLAGFLFYWAFWGLLFPLWALGPRGLREVFRDARPRFGRPAWLGLVLLLIPPILGFSTAFPRALGTGSIRWTVVSHILLDLSGLGALKYFS